MELTQITGMEVFMQARESLMMPDNVTSFDDEIFLSECIRRIAGFKCPCSKRVLIKELCQTLVYLAVDENELLKRIQLTVANLIVVGDLLELTDVTTTDLTVKSTWIFAAPPSFVARQSDITVIGIAPDEINPIGSISVLQHSGVRRFIPQVDNQNVSPKLLIQLGLIQISENDWLRSPKHKSEQQIVNDFNSLLDVADIAGSLAGHKILDTNTDPKFYNGRWRHSSTQDGRYLMKRPQIYGASQWCYGEFENGVCKKFVDLPLEYNSIRQRGCDVGWHLQMAIDKQVGHPQQCRISIDGEYAFMDFFSPIPMWTERRLIAIGQKVNPTNCLFSYRILRNELQHELNFIKEYLWLMIIEK